MRGEATLRKEVTLSPRAMGWTRSGPNGEERRGRTFHAEESPHLQALRHVVVQTMTKTTQGSLGASGGCQ